MYNEQLEQVTTVKSILVVFLLPNCVPEQFPDPGFFLAMYLRNKHRFLLA